MVVPEEKNCGVTVGVNLMRIYKAFFCLFLRRCNFEKRGCVIVILFPRLNP